MKIERMNFGRLSAIVAAGMLVYVGAAYPQTEKRVIEKPPEPPIALDRVTENSPAVNLTAVSKEVAPGILEVDRSSIRGKRLVISSGSKAKHMCIGKWIEKTSAGPTCEGSWVEW